MVELARLRYLVAMSRVDTSDDLQIRCEMIYCTVSDDGYNLLYLLASPKLGPLDSLKLEHLLDEEANLMRALAKLYSSL